MGGRRLGGEVERPGLATGGQQQQAAGNDSKASKA